VKEVHLTRQIRSAPYGKGLAPATELNEIGPYIFEDLGHPSLVSLREREHLDDIVAGELNDFDKLVRLRNWVATQWKFGNPEPYPPWDALIILDWIRNGKTGGFCGNYSIVFGQALMSLGWPHVRFVEIGTQENPICHFLVEVWHSQQRKWVILDATGGAGGTFTRNGLYLNALEMHEAWMSNDLNGITYNRPPDYSPSGTHPHDLEAWAACYYYLRVVWRQNFLSDPPPFWNVNNTFDRYHDCVEWYDPRVVQWEDSVVPVLADKDWPQHTRLSQRRCNKANLLYPSV